MPLNSLPRQIRQRCFFGSANYSLLSWKADGPLFSSCRRIRKPPLCFLSLDACLCWEFRGELVRGLLLLTAQDGNDDAPRFVQAVCGVWKFMLYGAMQACQFVARHSGIHVIFNLVVHLPLSNFFFRIRLIVRFNMLKSSTSSR